MSFDSIQHWADAAHRFPVLTHKQAVLLGQRIQAEEPGSEKRIKLANKLALHNMRLALKWTRAYIQPRADVHWGEQKSLDLLQEAFLGLRKAAEMYDPKRGYTFATYARAWVYRFVSRAHIDTMSDIRVPESSASEIFYYMKHGKCRNEKTDAWVAGVVDRAKQAYAMTSLDKLAVEGEEGTALLDSISEEQSLTKRTNQQQTFNHDYCHEVMSQLEIDEETQQIIMTYARIGNLDSALYKFKVKNKKAARETVRGQIKLIKRYVAAQ